MSDSEIDWVNARDQLNCGNVKDCTKCIHYGPLVESYSLFSTDVKDYLQEELEH